QVRLEDWQKYIESQFLEDEPEEAPVAVTEESPAIGQGVLALDAVSEETPSESPASTVTMTPPLDLDDGEAPTFRPPRALREEADTSTAIPTFHARRTEKPEEELPVFRAPVIPDVVSATDIPQFVSETVPED